MKPPRLTQTMLEVMAIAAEYFEQVEKPSPAVVFQLAKVKRWIEGQNEKRTAKSKAAASPAPIGAKPVPKNLAGTRWKVHP